MVNALKKKGDTLTSRLKINKRKRERDKTRFSDEHTDGWEDGNLLIICVTDNNNNIIKWWKIESAVKEFIIVVYGDIRSISFFFSPVNIDTDLFISDKKKFIQISLIVAHKIAIHHTTKFTFFFSLDHMLVFYKTVCRPPGTQRGASSQAIKLNFIVKVMIHDVINRLYR